MKYIESFHDGMHVSDVYLVKTKNTALTKNGKEYLNVTLQDKTGSVDAKVWEPNSPGINEFEVLDYVYVEGNITVYNGVNQLSIQRLSVAREGSYDPKDFLPVSERPIADMKKELEADIQSVQNPYLKQVLTKLFLENAAFLKDFSMHSQQNPYITAM